MRSVLHSFRFFALFGATLLAGCGANGLLNTTPPTAKVLPSPTLTPTSGTYAGVQTVTIADPVPTAAIYYTTDGSTPTVSSNLYVAPFPLKANATVLAIATAPGYNSSDVAKATYSIAAAQTAAPVLLPAATPGRKR